MKVNFLRKFNNLRPGITARKLGYQCEFYGTTYGGGTLCANFLSQNSLVYSFGVGEDVSFDLALIQKYNLTVYAFDPTPRSIEWVKEQNLPSQFHMVEYGVAGFDGTATFFPPENPQHVSHSLISKDKWGTQTIEVEVRRVSTLMNMLGHNTIDALKMDIEGAEFDVIPDMLASKIFPTQLLVEFHDRYGGIEHGKKREALDALKTAGYILINRSRHEYLFVKP